MLKHLMSGASLKSLMLYAPDDPAAAKEKLRAELLANTVTSTKDEPEPEGKEDDQDDENEDDEEADTEDGQGDDKLGENPNETEEEKVAREAKEADEASKAKIAAKAQRKQDRMQKRIDEAVAERERYKAELEAFKTANPDKNLTEEEVNSRAEILAAKKLADKEAANLQAEFEADCAKIQKEANKLDKEFDDNVNDMADQFGPIPSFMIGVLVDFDNGAEVLAHIAKNEEVAEKLYGFKNKPAKMTKELVEISNKLEAAKKKPKKEYHLVL